MFQFFESPTVVWSIIIFYSLFFFILFLAKLPRTNKKQQISTSPSTKVAKKDLSECTMFGFLEKLPKDDPIPDECMSCQKLVECLMKKRAYNWYVGQDLAQAE